jgi:hypothetical protein
VPIFQSRFYSMSSAVSAKYAEKFNADTIIRGSSNGESAAKPRPSAAGESESAREGLGEILPAGSTNSLSQQRHEGISLSILSKVSPFYL